jgi:hypothetical protein
VDFRASEIRVGEKRFGFVPLGSVPQQLVVAGGAENLVRSRLAESAA